MSGAKKSAIYILFGNLTSNVATVIGSIVLARLLRPSDYGYLVIAMLFDGFFNLFTITGFETYYIQTRGLSDVDDRLLLGHCWWLRFNQSLVLFAAQLICAIIVALLGYQTQGIMIGVLSFAHIISIVGRPKEAYLSKQMNFKPLALGNSIRDVSATFFRILFAAFGFGPLSFVLGQILGLVPRALFINRTLRLNVPFVKHYNATSNIKKFAFAIFSNTGGAYLTSQTDRLLVASFYPKQLVGLYQFSRNQSSLFFSLFLQPQGGLVTSYISKYKEGKEQIDKVFSKLGFILSFMLMFPMIAVFIYADQIITTIYGQKWSDSTDIFRIFMLYAILQVANFPLTYLLTGVGLPQVKARISLIISSIQIPILLICAYLQVDIIYYAAVYVATYLLKDVYCGNIGLKRVGLSVIDFYRNRLNILPVLIFELAVLYISYVFFEFYGQVAVLTLLFFTHYLVFSRLFYADRIHASADLILKGKALTFVNTLIGRK